MFSPKPKSICIAPSVAVGCGLSSRRLSIAGSNVVSESQSRGLAGAGDVREDTGEEAAVERGTEKRAEGALEDGEAPSLSDGLLAVLGTVNVNDDCLSMTFSFCNLESKSRRFSFSDVATSFLA